jgi:DNA-binding transcriptional regulator YdaS (Cro superfamily)
VRYLSSVVGMSESEPAAAGLAAAEVNHARALKLAQERVDHSASLSALQTGELSGPLPLEKTGASTKDHGLASYVQVAKSNANGMQQRRGLSSQDVENETDRSRRAIAEQRARAEAAMAELRKRMEFVNPLDDHDYAKGIGNMSLEQFLHRARQRFNTDRNKTLFKSNLDVAERKRLFEKDFDTMDGRDLEQEQPPSEEEIRRLGIELGLLRPDGGWGVRCDCAAKLHRIEGYVKQNERRLAKARMLQTYVNQVDHLVVIVDDFQCAFEEREETRLNEVLDGKEKMMTLLATVQHQKQQLDRLKRRVKDTSEVKALEEEEKAAQAQLEQMHAMISANAAHTRAGGAGGGGGRNGIPKALHRRRLRRVVDLVATNERNLMAACDFDGYEDPVFSQFMSMTVEKKTATSTCQTMNDDEFFDVYGKYPSGQVGFRLNQAIKRTTAGVADQAYEALKRATTQVSPPSLKSDVQWPLEARVVELTASELASRSLDAFNLVEAQRAKMMAQLTNVLRDADETICDNARIIFAQASGLVRDATKQIADDVRASMQRLATATTTMVRMTAKQQATNAQPLESGSWSGKATTPSELTTFTEHVEATRSGKKSGGPANQSPVPAQAASVEASAKPKAELKSSGAAQAAKAPAANARKKAAAPKATPEPSSPAKKDYEKPTARPAESDVNGDIPEPPVWVAPPPPVAPAPIASQSFGASLEATNLLRTQFEESTQEQMEAVRSVALRIARRLASCDFLAFDRGCPLDIELAETPQDVVSKLTRVAESLEQATMARNLMITGQLNLAVAKLREGLAKFVNSLGQAGLAFPPGEVETLTASVAVDAAPTELKVVIEELTGLDKALRVSSVAASGVVSAFAKQAQAALCGAVGSAVTGTKAFVPQLQRALEDIFQTLLTYGPKATRSETGDDDTSESPTPSTTDATPAPAVVSSAEMTPSHTPTVVLPKSFETVAASSTGDESSAVKAAAMLSLCLPELVPVINSAKLSFTKTIRAMANERSDLEDALADARAKLSVYDAAAAAAAEASAAKDAEYEGADPLDGMTVFEREAVRQRDALAAELQTHRDRLTQSEAEAKRKACELETLDVQLQAAQTALSAADERQKVSLRERHAALVLAMRTAIEETEAASRVAIEEGHAVAFVPVATTFADAICKLNQPSAVARGEGTSQQLAPVSREAQCQTTELELVHCIVGPDAPTEAAPHAGTQTDTVPTEEHDARIETSAPQAEDVCESLRPTSPPVVVRVTFTAAASQTLALSLTDVSVGADELTCQQHSVSTSVTPASKPRSEGLAPSPLVMPLIPSAVPDARVTRSTSTAASRAVSANLPSPSVVASVETQTDISWVAEWDEDDDVTPDFSSDPSINHLFARPEPPSAPASVTPIDPAQQTQQELSRLPDDPAAKVSMTKPSTKGGTATATRLPKPRVAPVLVAKLVPSATASTQTAATEPTTTAPVGPSTLESAAPDALVSAVIALSVALGIAPSFGDAPAVPLADIAARLSASVAAVVSYRRSASANRPQRSTPAQDATQHNTLPATVSALDGEPAVASLPHSEPSTVDRLNTPSILKTPGSSRVLKRVSIASAGPLSMMALEPGERHLTPVGSASNLTPAGVDGPNGASSRPTSTSHHPFFAGDHFERLVTPAAGGREFLSSELASRRPHEGQVGTDDEALRTKSSDVHSSQKPVHKPHPLPVASRTTAPSSSALATEETTEIRASAALVQCTAEKVAGSEPAGVQRSSPSTIDVKANPERRAVGGGAAAPVITDAQPSTNPSTNAPLTSVQTSPKGRPALVATTTEAGSATPEATAAVPNAPSAPLSPILAFSLVQLPQTKKPTAPHGTVASPLSTKAPATADVDRSVDSAVEIELALDAYRLLLTTLTEALRRLGVRSRADLNDAFATAATLPHVTSVVGKMHDVLTSVLRLLHTDSQLAKRGMARAMREAALRKRIENHRRLRSENDFAHGAQAAAFLDRQEEKMRQALTKLDTVKRQITAEREEAFKAYFLPVSDVPLSPLAPAMMQRRRIAMASDLTGFPASPTAADRPGLHTPDPPHSRAPPGRLLPIHHTSSPAPRAEDRSFAPDPNYIAAVRSLSWSGVDLSSSQRDVVDPKSTTTPPNVTAVVRTHAHRGKRATLGELRAPPAKHIAPPPANSVPGQPFRPDASLFASPLMGQSASMATRQRQGR